MYTAAAHDVQSGALARWVRAGHIQTDQHWTSRSIVRQRRT